MQPKIWVFFGMLRYSGHVGANRRSNYEIVFLPLSRLTSMMLRLSLLQRNMKAMGYLSIAPSTISTMLMQFLKVNLSDLISSHLMEILYDPLACVVIATDIFLL